MSPKTRNSSARKAPLAPNVRNPARQGLALSGGFRSSLVERHHRHRSEHYRAALLVNLKKGFTFQSEGASGLSRQGHSPVWAHGNYASHAFRSIPVASPLGQMPLVTNWHLTATPIIRYSRRAMRSSVLTKTYPRTAEKSAAQLCPPRRWRDGRRTTGHAFPMAPATPFGSAP